MLLHMCIYQVYCWGWGVNILYYYTDPKVYPQTAAASRPLFRSERAKNRFSWSPPFESPTHTIVYGSTCCARDNGTRSIDISYSSTRRGCASRVLYDYLDHAPSYHYYAHSTATNANQKSSNDVYIVSCYPCCYRLCSSKLWMQEFTVRHCSSLIKSSC